MRTTAVAIAVAAAIAGGVLAAGRDAAEPAASVTSTTAAVASQPGVASITGDDTSNDDALGSQGEDVATGDPQAEVEVGEPIRAIDVDRESVLADFRTVIDIRSGEVTAALRELDAARAVGSDVVDGLDLLIDEFTIFGEFVVTGIAITPDTLEVAPDLRELHTSLISEVDAIHELLSDLDPESDRWNPATVEIFDRLEALPSSLA